MNITYTFTLLRAWSAHLAN